MTDADLQSEDARHTVSNMLAEARESRGLSQKDVAEELFLTTTFIRYIDDGEFHKIPKPAFIKGYLRSYARVVSLNGDEVVARFEEEQQVTSDTPDIRDVTEEPVGSGSFTGPVVQTGVIGLAAVLAVGGLVWWMSADRTDAAPEVVVTSSAFDEPAYEPEPSPVIETMAAESSGMEEETPAPATLAPASSAAPSSEGNDEGAEGMETVEAMESMSSTTEVGSIDAEQVTDAAGEMAGEMAVEMAAEVSDASVLVERVQDGDTSYITVYANGEDSMEFSFSDECWVEIDDGSGEQIYGDLNRAGDVMTVMGQGPFDVLLGRAPAVRMRMNGIEVDLAPFTTSEQTARVRTARL